MNEEYEAARGRQRENEGGSHAGREARKKHRRRFRRLVGLLYFPVLFVYFELVFQIFVFGGIRGTFVFPAMFALAFGLFAKLLVSLLPERANRAAAVILTTLCAVWYATQVVYQHIFKAFLSVYSVGANGADAVGEFYMQALKAIGAKAFPVGLFLICVVVLVVLLKKELIAFPKGGMPELILSGGGAAILYVFALLALIPAGKSSHSPYDLYHKNFVMDLSMEKLGVLTSTRKDIMQTITGKGSEGLDDIAFIGLPGESTPTPVAKATPTPEPPVKSTEGPTPTPLATPTPTPTPIDTSPNILDIDFSALAEKESGKTIKRLHEYMANSVPTNKNEYTGMFEGYNLIMLTAEGYSQWAVNEKVTPTLYKMVHEGFYFENYYTPLWWTSTSDGEFVECTGLVPTGTNSFAKTSKHSMPFGFGWIFKKLGYSARAYHNHTYTYYHRDETHPNMGYDYKGAKGGGLDVKMTWPESDLEMMEKTIPEYIGDEKFHTYYMTVSGHMDYNFTGNSMSVKNRDYVKDLNLSEEAQAYLACQKELDLALEYLLAQLEKAGVAEKTVIVLSGDHYPYGLEKDKIDELAGHTVEENFELYKSHLILYCPGIKPVTVERPCSAMDIVPTLLNLFGIDYDSRLFMGQDIFSTAAPLVMFSNQSYITDKVMYNSKTGEAVKLTSEELPEDYVKTVSAIVKNKFNISAAIITEDYYSYLKPYLD